MDLSGKRILITAAAAGIGRESALAAAGIGADVLATDINPDGLVELRQKGIATETLDVTDMDAVAALIEREPAFDGVVNAAGYVHHGRLQDCTPEDWRHSFTLNVDSMYFILREALPKMIENGGGAIVNVASAASSLKGIPLRFAYGTTKAAVIGMTKSIAADYVQEGIRCNAVCPGTVDTPSLRQRVAELGKSMGGFEAAMDAFVARQPMQRLGTAGEVAALILYLLSDQAGFTTGQAHVIDGGILT
ncbi:MAG: SDR family oxidoreductase [Rhodobacteraceae bacterium]|nr:SDR family oxidoreductase [Paracoccaceae bacterium]